MADKASLANSEIEGLLNGAVESADIDNARILETEDASSVQQQLKSFTEYVDQLKNQAAGNNTFTVGDKTSPIGEASTAVTDDTATLTEDTPKASEETKEDLEKITNPDNTKLADTILDITVPNLFIYQPKKGGDSSLLNKAIEDSKAEHIEKVDGELADNSTSHLEARVDEGDSLSDAISTDPKYQKPSLMSKISTKCSELTDRVKSKFSSSAKSGDGLNTDVSKSALSGKKPTTLAQDIKNFNYKKKLANYKNSVLNGTGAIGTAYKKANEYKSAAMDKLNQANEYKKQLDSVKNLLKDKCNISTSSGINVGALLGGNGWNTKFSNPAKENAILDALNIFGDKSLLGTLKDAFGKVGSPFSLKDMEAMLCRLTTGEIPTAEMKDYVVGNIKGNNIVHKIGYVSDMIKSSIKNDDKEMVDKFTSADDNLDSQEVLKNLSQENIELMTNNASTRGAPRVLDKLVDVYGVHKIRNYKYKIIQAHLHDSNFDQTLFNEHVEKYQIDMEAYKRGEYGEYFAITHTTLNPENNINQLEAVDLIQVKQNVVMTDPENSSILYDALGEDAKLFIHMPVA